MIRVIIHNGLKIMYLRNISKLNFNCTYFYVRFETCVRKLKTGSTNTLILVKFNKNTLQNTK